MKRMIFPGCIILIFASMVLVSYAAMTMTREPISTSNLSDLKGKWEGWRSSLTGSLNFRTELEIYNDTLPLKGKLTVYDVQRRGMMSGTHTENFGNGEINNKGNFFVKWGGKNYIELSLYKEDGKMRLDGDFYFMGGQGTATLNKK